MDPSSTNRQRLSRRVNMPQSKSSACWGLSSDKSSIIVGIDCINHFVVEPTGRASFLQAGLLNQITTVKTWFVVAAAIVVLWRFFLFCSCPQLFSLLLRKKFWMFLFPIVSSSSVEQELITSSACWSTLRKVVLFIVQFSISTLTFPFVLSINSIRLKTQNPL